MEFEFIDQYQHQFPITKLVNVTTISRAGYYRWLKRGKKRKREINDEKLFELIQPIFEKHQSTYGRERIKIEIERIHGICVNHKRIRRVMKNYGLTCVIRPRFVQRKKDHHMVPNLLNQNFLAIRPDQKYAIDITYVPVPDQKPKWVYLCAIKDLYHQEIVAHATSTSQDMTFVIRCLEQLNQKRLGKGALIHSDQGIHFTNRQYQQRIKDLGLTPSMSRRGNCWDNACIENFFSHFKVESKCFSQPKSAFEVITAIDAYIAYYNQDRIQTKLKMSPVQFLKSTVA